MMNRLPVHISFIVTLVSLLMSFQADAQQMRTVEVGQMTTVHLVFASGVSYVDVPASEFISAKTISESGNMVALNALKPFDFSTTISVLEADGIMQTFRLKYSDTPQVLIVDTRAGGALLSDNRVSVRGTFPEGAGTGIAAGTAAMSAASAQRNISAEFTDTGAPSVGQVLKLDQRLYHIGDRNGGVEAYCSNLFEYSNVMYVILTLLNASDSAFETSGAQFAVENGKRGADALAADNALWPIETSGFLSCPSGGMNRMGYMLPKVTLEKGQKLKVYIYERGGGRNLILTLSEKDVNRAVSPMM